jgi:hypothetical protein
MPLLKNQSCISETSNLVLCSLRFAVAISAIPKARAVKRYGDR